MSRLSLGRRQVWTWSAIYGTAVVVGMVRIWAGDRENPDVSLPPDGPPVAVTPAGPWGQLRMAVHPRCPCTRSAMAVLASVWRPDAGVTLEVDIWVPPEGVPDAGWEADIAEVERWAERLGGYAHRDPGGQCSARWGAKASGQVVGHDPSGRLLFSGGLTASRGHATPSAVAEAVAAWLERRASPGAGVVVSGVFGCGW